MKRLAIVCSAALALLTFALPAYAQTPEHISAGLYHTCAITASGGIKCWGSNAYGQLGSGTTASSSTPVNVTGLASSAVSVSAGLYHTCAVTSIGSVQCWGRNVYGQLGNGTTTDSATPVTVTGLTSGVTSVSVGLYHTCATTAAGGVQCWGRNGNGQLGNGTTTDSATPVDVTDLTSGVTSISVGLYHACAITTSGSVKCWGSNTNGQLGNGLAADAATPVDVVGLGSGVASASAGSGHTCAVTTGGGVQCWGSNAYGQLGSGTTASSTTPVNVTGFASGVASVNAGLYHTCATTAEGVRCWGSNSYGQLGNGTTTNSSAPVDVTGLTSGVTSVSAGLYHTCAITASGGVKCWGSNTYGQVGNGTAEGRSTPEDEAGLTSGATSVSAGSGHTCAVTAAGGVQCWGVNTYGQLGNGTTTNSSAHVEASGLGSGVASVSAGYDHACATTTSGTTQCWGSNSYGQLGNSTATSSATLVNGALDVSAGSYHTCATTTTTAGSIVCWGSNSYGQLGNSTTTDSATPVTALNAANSVRAGYYHTCALTNANGVKCWGYNVYGQLGNGTTTDSSAPVDVTGLTSGTTGLSAGSSHTCAVTAANGVKCWGSNTYGQLGSDTTASSSIPVDVVGLTSDATSVSAGYDHTCAVTTAGGVRCWGGNTYGQLGNGTTASSTTPVNVTGLASGVASVSAGYYHTCALTLAGGVKCWGRRFDPIVTPVDVVDLVGVDNEAAEQPALANGIRLALLGQRALRLNADAATTATVRLYDVIGRERARLFAGVVAGTVEVPLPAGLSAGAYIVAVETAAGRASRMLVVR